MSPAATSWQNCVVKKGPVASRNSKGWSTIDEGRTSVSILFSLDYDVEQEVAGYQK